MQGERILSGNGTGSTDLWKAINKVRKKRRRKKIARAAGRAVYILGCRCQELEEVVRKLEAEVQKLKSKLA